MLFYVSVGAVDEDYVAVITHILINTRINNAKPFAYIGERSVNRSKLEVLLPPGMIFRNKGAALIKVNRSIAEFSPMILSAGKLLQSGTEAWNR